MEFNQATPYAYQMIALCLCNNMTLSLTEAPPKKKLAGRAGLLPPSCIISGICTAFCHFQEVIWSPWLRAEGGYN